MIPTFDGMFRLTVAATAASAVLAVAVGKLAPAPVEGRLRTMPEQVGISGFYYGEGDPKPRFLDVESGLVRGLSVLETDRLDQTSVAPWRDESGASQVVGRWSRRSGHDAESLATELGLARYTFPEGTMIDRVRTDVPPASPPCWLPGTGARVIFAAGDGRLYRHDFEGPDGLPSPRPGRPTPVTWGIRPPGLGEVYLADPCWPADASFGGRVLVSLSEQVSRGDRMVVDSPRIWWLKLDAEARTILAAGRVLDRPAEGDPGLSERCPWFVGTRGRESLAYLTHPPTRDEWQVRLSPIVFDRATGAPRGSAGRSRLVASGCAPIAPRSSADGRWLSFIVWNETYHAYVARASLAPGLTALDSQRVIR